MTSDERLWDHSATIEAVRQAIVNRSCSALSFDVFDTVLWRRVPRPTDLFVVLGARLRELNLAPPWLTPTQFREVRVQAERRARAAKESLGPEVCLAEIWSAMPADLFDGHSYDLIAAELEAERELTVADSSIASLIELATEHEMPLALVSDTYFSEDQIRFLLDRDELQPLIKASLFCSQHYGVGKGSGLWPIVLDELGLRPEQVIHVGDHPLADDRIPGQLGIRTAPYRRLDSRLVEVLRREDEPIAEDDVAEGVDEQHGDFGITALRAKAVLSDLPTSGHGPEEAWRFGAGVLGPVLTGFAEWIADKAHREGIPVVWCPMREGEMLAALINNAAAARGWEVAAKPIWLSRHVLAIASLNPFDPDEVLDLLCKPHRPTVRQMLSMLDLRPGEVPTLAAKLDDVVDCDVLCKEISDTIAGSPHLQNRLAVTTTRMQERLLTSLQQCGALDAEPFVLVDLGWGGTIQRLLARLLRQSGPFRPPVGWYLVTHQAVIHALGQGLRVEGFLASAGHPRAVSDVITRSPEALEQIVSSLCGSLIGFEPDGSPVLGPFADSPARQAERIAARDGIFRFQRLWNDQVRGDASWPMLTEQARPRLAGMLRAAIALPTPREAALFGSWEHEENFGSDTVTALLGTELLTALPHLSPNDLRDLDMREAFWPALAAASDPQLGAAAQAVASGVVSPEAFEQSQNAPMTRLRYRTRDGQWQPGLQKRVRINHNGLSFVRMTVPAVGVTDIALALPGARAVVRVDWIEARPIGGGCSTEDVLRWETPQELASLKRAGVSRLAGNVFAFHGGRSALVLPLEAWSGRGVVEVRVTAGFAMLPHEAGKLGRPPAPPAPASTASPLARRARRAKRVLNQRGVSGLAVEMARFVDRRTGTKT